MQHTINLDAFRDHPTALKTYLAASGDPNAQVEVDGCSYSLLQWACSIDSLRCSSTLLAQRFIEIEPKDPFACPSPLHLACMWKILPNGAVSYGDSRLANVLCARGTDCNGGKGKEYPLRPIHLALLNSNIALIKTLLLYKVEVERELPLSLWCLACSHCVEGLFLLHSAAPVAVRLAVMQPVYAERKTILHIACDATWHDPAYVVKDESLEPWERLVFFVDTVLSFGADINAQDDDGRTALHYAWHGSDAFLAYHLVNICGADCNIKDKEGYTPFEWHASQSSPSSLVLSGRLKLKGIPLESFLRLMLAKGVAGLNSTEDHVDSALHYAIANTDLIHDEKLIQLMIECGSDPNAMNEKHQTPLYLACLARRPLPFIKVLLAGGADPTIPCPIQTPLQVLATVDPFQGVSQIAMELLQASMSKQDVNDVSIDVNSHVPFLSVPPVATHPYWLDFRNWLEPPKDDKEARERHRVYVERCCELGLPFVSFPDRNSSVTLRQEGDEPEGIQMVQETPMKKESTAKTMASSGSAISLTHPSKDTDSSPLSKVTIHTAPASSSASMSHSFTESFNAKSPHRVLKAWERVESTPYYRRLMQTAGGMEYEQFITDANRRFQSPMESVTRYGEELFRPDDFTQSQLAMHRTNGATAKQSKTDRELSLASSSGSRINLNASSSFLGLLTGASSDPPRSIEDILETMDEANPLANLLRDRALRRKELQYDAEDIRYLYRKERAAARSVALKEARERMLNETERVRYDLSKQRIPGPGQSEQAGSGETLEREVRLQ